VAWGKALGLVFGHTVYAIATVLAVFMGGLAAGSAWLGRWCERSALGRRPVTLYAWIELGVALGGALSLAGIAGVRALYGAAYPAFSGSAATLVVLRFFASALVLLVPTFLMGGTLPILVHGVTRRSAELGARLSRLYWVNTAGAAAGTLLAGFILLPWAGLRLTVAGAVVLNVFAGSVALWLGRNYFTEISPCASDDSPREKVSETGAPKPVALLAAFCAVGASGILYEVAWTRLLASVLGSSTYAFTLMLATFLTGIVFGGILFERWHARGGRVDTATFATTQTFTALAALLFLVFFRYLPEIVPPLLQHDAGPHLAAIIGGPQSFPRLVITQFLASALAMFPAAVVFGFNFPAVALLIAGGKRGSGYAAAVGRAYAANTLGAIAGAVLAGFWLVPLVGSFRVVALGVILNLTLAGILELLSEPRRPRGLGAVFGVLVATLFVVISGAFYNRALAVHGTVVYADMFQGRLSVAEAADTTDLVFAEDGLNATISVVRAEDYVSIRTNGKVDASNKDNITQLLLAHLPGVFHPAPRRVLVIGFGSGMTVSAIARYAEVEKIICVEIEPAVIRASAHLESLHRGVVRDPRLTVVLDDARNYLMTTQETFDLIISEPSNPWIAGVAALYTAEYYREARARLRPGGMFVQWVQAYSLFAGDLRMIFHTFTSHFPQVTLWHGESTDLFLIGQTDQRQLDFTRIRALWENPPLRADYKELGLKRPEGLTGYFQLDDAPLRSLAAGAALNTDNHTRLEYSAPRALLGEAFGSENLEMIQKAQPGLLPALVRIENPATALLAAGETRLEIGETEDASQFLAQIDPAQRSLDLELSRGRLALAQGRMPEAEASFTEAMRLDFSSLDAAVGLANVARRRLQFDQAELLYRQVLGRDPTQTGALDGMAELSINREQWAQAAVWLEKRLAADPQPGALRYARVGEVLLKSAQLTACEKYFRQALERDPYSFSAHRNLGELYHFLKQWEPAAAHLEAVVRFHPDNDPKTYALLSDVYRRQGRIAEARSTLLKGRRVFPGDATLQKTALP